MIEQDHPDILGAPIGSADSAPRGDDLANLRLDQVISSIAAWSPETDVSDLLARPLTDIASVRHRQAVVTDLQHDSVLDAVRAFCHAVSHVRQGRDNLARHSGGAGWHGRARLVELAVDYVNACYRFRDALSSAPLRSRGLLGVRDLISTYVGSVHFRSLAEQSAQVLDALGSLSFGLHLTRDRVTLGPTVGSGDYVDDIARLLVRLAPAAPSAARLSPVSPTGPSPLELQLVERVAARSPGPFDALDAHCRRYAEVIDPRLERFCEQVAFYVSYLDHIGPLRAAGLPFCLPDVRPDASAVHVVDAFDLALAHARRAQGASVVLNDVHLTGAERVLVVTGPNQAGKTTYARMVGQIHYLASLGLPVPARSASVPLVDRVLTHFAAVETPEDPVGRLEQDLWRVREVLEHATDRSVVVMNEVFSSTTQQDALVLGRRVLETLAARGTIVVFVTFVDALCALGPETVSMVSQAPPDDPARRTFRIERQPPIGSAHAVALARAHRLTYDDVVRRMQR